MPIDLTLYSALIWRTLREQWRSLVFVPVGGALLLVVGAVGIVKFPGIFTGPTRAALLASATRDYGSLPKDTGVVLAVIVGQGPYLVALFAAMIGATTAVGLIGNEISRGGIEALLSRRFTAQQLFYTFVGTGLTVTLGSAGLLLLGTSGVSLAALAVVGADLHFANPLTQMALAVPVAMWATLLGVVLTFRFPALTLARIGASGSVTQALAMLPAVVVLIVSTFRGDVPQASLVGWTAGVVVVLLVLLGFAAKRLFRVERFLES